MVVLLELPTLGFSHHLRIILPRHPCISAPSPQLSRIQGMASSLHFIATMGLHAEIVPKRGLFIDGEWVEPVKGKRIPIINPTSEESIGDIPAATSEDVDAAVKGWRHCVHRLAGCQLCCESFPCPMQLHTRLASVESDSCLAGDVAHARLKFEEQLSNLDYSKFVDFMCSTSKENSWRSLDLSLCDRPIFGTWDDHDYNWEDGDKRMPTKEEQKQLYLDALGVPSNSPRRSHGRGIYWRHTLNAGVAGR